jgi:6-phosphogluconolactonase
MRMYVGTYTKKTSRGIYGVELDADHGTLSEPTLLAEVPNPSFLAINTLGDRLYAACEPGELNGHSRGTVAGFCIERGSGNLVPINTQAAGEGAVCHVSVTADGKWVAAADYGDGIVSLLPLRADGEIEPEVAHVRHIGNGPNAKRQEKAHAHCAVPDPSGRFLLSCDLGTDEIYAYRIDNGLAAHSVLRLKPGTGPRHLVFSSSRRFVYSVNELDNSVDVLAWNVESGTLTPVQRCSTLPTGFTGTSTAGEIAVHPNGRLLYASNRGHETVAHFQIDPTNGHLSGRGQTDVLGKSCRHFAIDPTGRILIAANSHSDQLIAFRINHDTGDLTPTGSQMTISQPVCIVFGLP